ncbi:MAG: nitronate monooxygenase [Halioglobus sp.]|jgi:nitronate monooxygenase
MIRFPSERLTKLLECEIPIVQAPMAGANDAAMAIAVASAGAIGSLPCAMLNQAQIESTLLNISGSTNGSINFNFFCHTQANPDPVKTQSWRKSLERYYEEFNLDPNFEPPTASRKPFDETACRLIENHRPRIVSFHFGLPEQALLQRVKDTGAIVLSSATTVEEAVWLEDHGADAVIAQGAEAGGHRGMFLATDISSQPGTFSLIPQVVDAVGIPVIASGGIADGRGIAAAFALGADGVQIGTAYLYTPEATISALHREALSTSNDQSTSMTNVFSGKPARGIRNRVMLEAGPMSDKVPAFPTAGAPLAPLKMAAEARSSTAFSSLWSGQSASLCAAMPAADLTLKLATDAASRLRELSL